MTIDYFNEYFKEVSFEDINYKLIEGFEFFLRARKYHTNTIANHHKHIKRYIIRAIKEDLLEMKRNPYQSFKVKKEVGKCQVLNDDELERFENLTFDNPNTFDEKVKDMFLFGVYTGLRFRDIYRLRKINFFDSPDGMVMEFQARKTTKHGKKFLDLLFEGKPRIIVDKYMPDDNKLALFKGLTNPKVNRLLKILARKANIPKSLCFKDARDTCATYLMKRFPITLVRDELQHSNIKITNKYTHNNEEETKQAFKRVWNNKQEIT